MHMPLRSWSPRHCFPLALYAYFTDYREVDMHIYIYIYIYTHRSIYTYMYILSCVCVSTHIYMYPSLYHLLSLSLSVAFCLSECFFTQSKQTKTKALNTPVHTCYLAILS